jgi:hypothetical protein
VSASYPRRRHYASCFILAAAAVLGLLASAPARAEIIPVADMLRGIHVTQTQCAAKRDAVWVTAYGHEFCIRYYLSSAGGEGLQPVVYLAGDQLGLYDPDTRSFKPNPNNPPDYRDVDFDTEKAGRWMANFSKSTRAPAIYLARVGVDGSSGFHGIRKTVLELHALNAALDAIKRRHRFTGFHLVGQSGGAKLVGGLLALRTDIACAVPGSGPLDLKADSSTLDPGKRYFNASDFAPVIALSSRARILLVTDPADERVVAEQQTGFVRKLRQAGGKAEQFFVRATDPLHHGVTRYATVAAAECIRGASNDEISMKLSDAVARTAAAPRRDVRTR